MDTTNRKIALAQIQGTQALVADVAALKTSYDANKVLTDIVKDGGGTYNSNELLKALKQVIDAQLGGVAGGSTGTIEERIQAAKDDLQTKINAINEMPVRDRVRVTGSITPGGLLTFDQDIATTVPGIDKSTSYALYYVDNRPMVNELGDNLTYDFLTGTTNGVPSRADIADADPTDGVDYVPIAAPVGFKMFPIGQFTFSQLPMDYMLDNNELNMVAYSQAIDAIVVELTQDQGLIEAIKDLVGTETVQNQIKLITDALATRVSVLEGEVDTLNGDATTAGSVAKAVKDASDALASTIAANKTDIEGKLNTEISNLTTTVGNNKTAIEQALADETTARVNAVNAESSARTLAINTLTTTVEDNRKVAHNENVDRKYEIALINAVKPVTDSYVATAGQTKFTLSAVPNDEKVFGIINSLTYYEDVDFTVNRATREVTWTFTAAADGFDLEAGMFAQFVYHKTDAVTAPTHI